MIILFNYMPSRKLPIINDEYYHIYNRGFNKKPIFISNNDYQRALETIRYYQFSTPSFKYSILNRLTIQQKNKLLQQLVSTQIDILAFCFMPNHFHFLIKQISDDGILKSISKFSNSYSKYFNTLHEKNGPVFDSRFKAVRVTSNEQMLHLSRYIHLNPYTASIEKNLNQIQNYPYSSLKEYMHPQSFTLTQTDEILGQFKSSQDYLSFTLDQADYQKKLHLIKSITTPEW